MLLPLPLIWQSLCFNSLWPITPGAWWKRTVKRERSLRAGLTIDPLNSLSLKPAAQRTIGHAR